MFPENNWSPERLATKLRNGSNYAQGHRGELRQAFETAKALGIEDPFANAVTVADVAANAETDFGEQIMKAARDLKSYRIGGNESAEVRPMFKPTARLMQKKFEGTSWIVEGLVQTNGLGAISGEPKSDKTWCALELALSVTTNTTAFGEFKVKTPGPVALFLAEDGERSIRNRMRALCKAKGLDPHVALGSMHDVCRAPLNLQSDVELTILIASLRRVQPVLAIIDPLRDVHGANEDSSTEMADVLGRLRSVRDLVGCSIAFVHHSAKSSADSRSRRSGQKMRGSSAIHGAIDFGFYVTDVDTDGRSHWSTKVEAEIKAGQGAGIFKLDLMIDDDEHGEAINAEWEFSRKLSNGGDAEKGHEKKIDALVMAMVSLGGFCTVRALRSRAGGRYADVSAAISELVERGWLVKETRGIRLQPAILAARKAELAAKDGK